MDNSPTALTVGDLMDILETLDHGLVVHTTEPPFDGVRIIEQEGGESVLIAPRTQNQEFLAPPSLSAH